MNCLSLYMPKTRSEDALFLGRIGYEDGWNIFDLLGFGNPMFEGDGDKARY